MSNKGIIRKQEILDTAMDLFSTKGYSQTTVNDIINLAGFSKGGFYHHFKSKEEIIDSIIMDYVSETLELSNKIADDPLKNGFEKYKKLFLEIQKRRIKNRDRYDFLTKMFLSEENILFKYRYTERILKITQPPLVKIIKQGKKEGHFKLGYPEEAAETIISFGTIYRAKIAVLMIDLPTHPENLDKIIRIIHYMQNTIERILGLTPGSLNFISQEFQKFIAIKSK